MVPRLLPLYGLLGTVLAPGCGRIAFDEQALASDAAPDAGNVTGVPLTCEGARSVLAVTGNVDLVAAASATLIQIAYVERAQASMPFHAELHKTGELLSGPAPVASAMQVDALPGLAFFGDRAMLQASVGTMQQLVVGNLTLANAQPYDIGTGIIGRDCLVTTRGGDEMAMIADGTELHAGYIQPNAVGPQVPYDTGGTITQSACQQATDHNHMVYRTTTADCIGTTVTPMATSPTFSTETTIGGNCNDPRAALVDASADTGSLVWKQGTGEVMLSYIAPTPDAPVQLATSAQGPRVSSDGTRIWVAWTANATGTLQLAHLLPRGTPTVVDTALRPLGDESYELIRDGDVVYLVALTENAVHAYKVCAP